MTYLKVNKEALQALDKKITDDKTAIAKQLKEIEEKSKAHKAELENEKIKQLEEKEANNLVQLPLWPEATRGVPNSILRGSLFAAIQPQAAKYCNRKQLVDNDRFSITFTGQRLTQTDLNVWETILHLARDQNLGSKIYYTETSFLEKIGRSTGGNDKKWLKSVLSKLNATAVEITFKDKKTYSFEGSLLAETYRERDTESFVLMLEPKLHRLFEEGNTWISWEDRQKIGKQKFLALWLHGYISTHANWYPHKVETLRDLSGSETKNLKHYRDSLKDALDHLLNLGIIRSYSVEKKSDLVHIERENTKAQKKHLENKEKERKKHQALSKRTRAD